MNARLLFTAMLLPCGSAFAQPANNFCDSPAAVSGTGSFFFSTINASTDGPPLSGFAAGMAFNDVWFCWTAAATGRFVFSTCGTTTLDTVLAVYPQCGCLSFSQSPLAANDDACGTQSRVEIDAVAGSSYFVRIGSYATTQFGAGNLSVQAINPGTGTDVCSGATPVVAGSPIPFSLAASTSEIAGTLPISCGLGNVYNDVWFVFTPPASGPYRIATCNQTTADTVLAVYAGPLCPTAGIAPVVCDDESCGSQSSVVLPAIGGTPYFVRVGGYSASTRGSGTLSVDSALVLGPVASPDGSRQYFLLDSMSWMQANASAIAMGGTLAAIGSVEENGFLADAVLRFDSQDRLGWIGINDASAANAFGWSSGEAVSYTNWLSGQPRVSASENYGVLDSASGAWSSRVNQPASDRIYGIVELGAPVVTTCVADVSGGPDVGLSPDGTVDGADFIGFINSFGIGDASVDNSADVDPPGGDGTIDGSDFIAFINAFAVGC